MDMNNLVARFEKHFGLGSRPDLRKALYQRVAQVASEDPSQRAYLVISSVVADAAGKDDPGRYFAKVVLSRLQEKGFMIAPSIAW